MSYNKTDKKYLKLCKKILKKGNEKEDRTGTGTTSVFGHDMRFNLSDGFPLLTTKKVHLKSIIHELLWFISGDTNTKYLTDNGVKIWNAWANPDGSLGKVYGHQWRNLKTDQLKTVIENIKTNPNSRRLIVSSWNVEQLDEMNLPPCHYSFEFYVHGNKLSMKVNQRSADVFLGLPFNIASYSLLLMMVAQVTGLQAHELIHSIGNAHIYDNHQEQIKEQLTRKPYPLPTMHINKSIMDIDEFKYNDFLLTNYHFHPIIKGKVAV